MAAQRLYRVVNPGQFRFRATCMDFLVAHVVQQHRWSLFPAFGTGDQMMQALRHIRRNRASAKRTG